MKAELEAKLIAEQEENARLANEAHLKMVEEAIKITEDERLAEEAKINAELEEAKRIADEKERLALEEEAKLLAEQNAKIAAELEAKKLAEEEARIAEEQRLAEEAALEEANTKVIPDLPPLDD